MAGRGDSWRRVRTYERDIRWFVILLVVLMAVLNHAAYTLMRRAVARLERTEAAHLLLVGAMVQSRLRAELGLTLPDLVHREPDAIDRAGALVAAWSAQIEDYSLCVLDLQGRQLAPRPRPGTEEIDLLAGLAEPESRQLEPGRSLLTGLHRDRRGVTIRSLLLPLPGVRGPPLALLQVTQPASVIEGYQRLARTLQWLRLVSFAAALLLSVLYVRYVLLPFRLIARRARQLRAEAPDPRPAGGLRSEVPFVIDTFETTIRDLRAKEAELEKLYGAARRRAGEIAAYNDHILRSVPVGIAAVDWMGRVTTLNPAACRILGLPPMRGAEEEIAHLAGLDSPLSQWVAHGLPAGERLESAGWVFVRQGATLYLEVSASPIFDLQRRPIGGVAILVDVSERNRLEQLVVQRRRLAELGEMSAGIAHEFRNPLQTVLGYANLMQRQLGPDHPHSGYLAEVVRVVRRLDLIIRDFMSFVRPAVLEKSPADLADLAREVLARPHVAEAAGGCRTEIREAPGTPPAIVDAGLLGQAFENVIVNAFQAMEGNGELAIELAPVGVAGLKTGSVQVVFQDTGPGIPPGQEENIFSPFVTTRASGTGLGLAIAQRIIVAHDGVISASSPAAGGARFEIILPAGEPG